MATQEREQEIQQDIFREAMENAKKAVSWGRLTPSQKEKLIAKCLQDRVETADRQPK